MVKPFSWWRMIYWRFRWHVFPRRRYATRCQYCATTTGETMHAWATEDVCRSCAAIPEYVVESGGAS